MSEAFESMKAGLKEAIFHSRGQSNQVVTNHMTAASANTLHGALEVERRHRAELASPASAKEARHKTSVTKHSLDGKR